MSWWKRSFAALLTGSYAATLLFLLTAVPLCAFLAGKGFRDPFIFAFGCLPAVAAVFLFMVSCALAPSLVESSSLGFPLNITLPLVFSSFIFLAAQTLAIARPTIALVGEEPRVDQLAARPDVLGTGLVVQMVGLTLVSALQKSKGEER